MLNPNLLAFIVPKISMFIQADGKGQIESPMDIDQEYVYFI